MVYDKGHLVPEKDFYYEHERRATYCKYNMFPIWRPFYILAWEPVEQYLRHYSTKNNVQLVVYTGTFGTLRLKDVDGTKVAITLTGVDEKFPIPSHIWKIAYDKEHSAAIAFIGVNSYLQRKSYNDLCEDISSQLSWISDCANSHLYVCKFNDFTKFLDKYNIRFPMLKVNRLLSNEIFAKKERYKDDDDNYEKSYSSEDSDESESYSDNESEEKEDHILRDKKRSNNDVRKKMERPRKTVEDKYESDESRREQPTRPWTETLFENVFDFFKKF